MSGGTECRIYVGNLPPDVRMSDVEELFDKFGRIVNTDLKIGRGAPFAFVEFEDPRDAEDAVIKRNGYNLDGYRIRVEFPRGGRSGSSGGGGRRAGSQTHRGGPGRRSANRVQVSGLPVSGSWQDLKDHFREAGDVCFADVKDGYGIVEFVRYDDMKYAIKKLDDTRFRSHEGESAYIRVKEDGTRNRSKSRSRSRSPVRNRSRSRSRSRSPARRRRRSPSYSPPRKVRRNPRFPSSSPSVSRSRSRSRSRTRSSTR